MKQLSYVTVCETLLKKLFVLLLCFEKGGVGNGQGLLTQTLLQAAVSMTHIICHHSVSVERKVPPPSKLSMPYYQKRSMFSDTNGVCLICEESDSIFQRACFLYYFNEEF